MKLLEKNYSITYNLFIMIGDWLQKAVQCHSLAIGHEMRHV